MSFLDYMEKINNHSFFKQTLLVCFITVFFLIVGCDEHFGGDQQGEESPAISKEMKNDQATTLKNFPKREARGAGLFYPKEEKELYALLDELFAKGSPLNLPGVRAIHVPHAGYIYSGEVAAAAMRELAKGFERVFVLAANHSGEADFSGVSLPEVSSYLIPGAEIPLSPVVQELRKQPLFTSVPAVHTKYMIEVELPFLQAIAGKAKKPSFSLVPMIVGRLDRKGVQQLAAILNQYADDKTIFVFSVDLSHFYTDSKAREFDFATIDAILSRNQEALARSTADGPQVLMTMVELAELNGWDATLLKYRNSGDVTGDRDRVVGYAGIAFHEPVRFSLEQRRILLELARKSIEHYLDKGSAGEWGGNKIKANPIFFIPRGVFVTLKKNGELRGCIGDLISNEPLYKGIKNFAIKAATQDPRFKPVTRDELDGLVLSISVLEYPRRVKVNEPDDYLKLLKPRRDGVILMYKGRSSTFLPQVWESLPEPELFLSRLCMKQGAPANCWKDPETVLFRYSAYEFGEE